MAHILVKTPATISHTWEVDGTPTNPSPDTTTIGIARADGTELVAPGTATADGGTGIATFALTTTHTTELDRLVGTWTATFGTPVTVPVVYEIVGGWLFTESQLRAHPVRGDTPFADANAYPDARIVDVREQITDDFAAILCFSPIPRYARETLDGTGTDELTLAHLYPTRTIAVTVDATVWAVGELAALGLDPAGVAVRPDGLVWPAGRRNITIAYVYGGDPGLFARDGISSAELALAAMRRAAMLLAPSLSSTVATTVTPEGTAYTFEAAGRRIGDGDIQWYGVPSIDSVLNRYRRHMAKVGF